MQTSFKSDVLRSFLSSVMGARLYGSHTAVVLVYFGLDLLMDVLTFTKC